MIDLNEHLGKVMGENSIAHLLPRRYVAYSLDDFLRQRKKVKPTQTRGIVGALFNGKAIIQIEGTLLYTSINYSSGTLFDLVNSVDVGLMSPAKFLLRNAEDQTRIHDSWLIYRVKEKQLSLIYFSPYGPPKEEKSPVADRTDYALSKT